jgi:hypothetical protein
MKSLRLYIIVLAALLVVYLVAQYNKPKGINWDQTFDSNDKIPFGTYLIHSRLNDIFPDARVQTFREPAYNVLNDHDITHASYIIICNSVNFNEYDYAKLLKFIKNGNDVFIGAAYFGEQLNKHLKVQATVAFRSVSADAAVKFTNRNMDTSKLYRIDRGVSNTYFTSFDTAKATALGKNENNEINFVRYTLGEGSLYLNCNPLMFSNYSLVDADGAEYASRALSFVKNDGNVIWDQYYALGREDDGSEMRVFLRTPALRWAFYTAFFSLVLFVLYEIKRRQRIIPVLPPLENTSLSFVNVVGQVYYEQRDNNNICNKKIAYFLEYLRSTYYLRTNELNQEFADQLAQKTGIEHGVAINLVDFINYLNTQPRINDRELIRLNQLIENFYTQSK